MKVVVLCSGGMDSTVALYEARRRHQVLAGLSCDYGSKHNHREQPSLRDAVVMGLTQVTALFPGVSRSGVTMAAGLAGGLTRPAAARFSFLMAVPIVGAASINEIPVVLASDPGGPEAAGFLASLVAGYASVAWLLRYLRNHSFWPFALYCAIVAMGSGLLLR
jgi:undecaprenyl-diphosphatase